MARRMKCSICGYDLSHSEHGRNTTKGAGYPRTFTACLPTMLRILTFSFGALRFFSHGQSHVYTVSAVGSGIALALKSL